MGNGSQIYGSVSPEVAYMKGTQNGTLLSFACGSIPMTWYGMPNAAGDRYTFSVECNDAKFEENENRENRRIIAHAETLTSSPTSLLGGCSSVLLPGSYRHEDGDSFMFPLSSMSPLG